jgi:hypothetical protein
VRLIIRQEKALLEEADEGEIARGPLIDGHNVDQQGDDMVVENGNEDYCQLNQPRYPEDLYLYMAFWVQKPGEIYLINVNIIYIAGTVSHIGIPTLQQNNIDDMGEV